MGAFFGTDGIRGKYGEDINCEIAYKCGNALAELKPHSKIVIGRDTRLSGQILTLAFSTGATLAGADVIDIGICPSAGIAYITRNINADFGVVISASHNQYEYNGIKIFDKNGFKLSDKTESILERKFMRTHYALQKNIGAYEQMFIYQDLYAEYLLKTISTPLTGLKVVIDASNGASFKIAPKVFRDLGASVIELSCENDGANINNNCGSLFPEKLCQTTISTKADMGFAFDGDADRIIACDNKGNLLDGDKIVYIFAKNLKKQGKLSQNYVVGTRHTNMGLEESLKENGISLLRADIGDKYVIEKIEEKHLSLGGEKSGHVILREYATTGDGILCAIKLAEIACHEKTTLFNLAKCKEYPQINIDLIVQDKMRVINSEALTECVNLQEKILGENYRVMVRVSGTEDKIRIMVEGKNKQKALKSAKNIEKIVNFIDKGV